MGEVQRMLQSNENINLEDGVQVHLIHIGMLHGGAAVYKSKHYGFKLSKFLDTKQCITYLVTCLVSYLPTRWLQTWLARRNILTGIIFIKGVNSKASWPKSCTRRQVFQKVSMGCPK